MPEAVLLIDDDHDVLSATALAIRHLGFDTVPITHPDAIPALLAERAFAAILLDLNFGRGVTSSEQGMMWLDRILHLDRDASVVVVTAHGDVALAVEAMKRGAVDFVTKPWANERMAATVRNAVTLRNTRRTAARLEQQASEWAPNHAAQRDELLGKSAAMQHVRSLVARAAPTNANVLILGENGTGKELVARAIHRASLRAAKPLISVDLGAVSETLFESELFGHKRGAFTDAKTDRVGRIPAADGATLFLDEIGNLPPRLQPKLLTALERQEVTPVGSNRPVHFDARIVSATNMSSELLADERYFRTDLLFRLNTVEIYVPSLRERRDDIALLAEHFLAHYSHKYGKTPGKFSEAALAAMHAYDWPGNVRALRHAVERAVVLGTGTEYSADDLALPKLTRESIPVPAPVESPPVEDFNLDRMEKQMVERALRKHAWNISLAAKELGLTRASLYRRMERHGL